MNGDTLTEGQVLDLTKKVQRDAQIRALETMGIHFFVRPDGTPAVPAAALLPIHSPAEFETVEEGPRR
jgi:hypothetical protein